MFLKIVFENEKKGELAILHTWLRKNKQGKKFNAFNSTLAYWMIKSDLVLFVLKLELKA